MFRLTWIKGGFFAILGFCAILALVRCSPIAPSISKSTLKRTEFNPTREAQPAVTPTPADNGGLISITSKPLFRSDTETRVLIANGRFRPVGRSLGDWNQKEFKEFKETGQVTFGVMDEAVQENTQVVISLGLLPHQIVALGLGKIEALLERKERDLWTLSLKKGSDEARLAIQKHVVEILLVQGEPSPKPSPSPSAEPSNSP